LPRRNHQQTNRERWTNYVRRHRRWSACRSADGGSAFQHRLGRVAFSKAPLKGLGIPLAVLVISTVLIGITFWIGGL
jgi:hypothetical protein